MTTQAISAASALISGPSRMLNIAAAGTTMVLTAEVFFRGLLALSNLCQTGKAPENYQFKEQNAFSKNVIDFRALTRNLPFNEVAKLAVISTIATMVLTQTIYQVFGAPIKGINMFGRLIGVQVSNNGIYDSLNFSDWREFFHQPVNS